MVAAVKLLNAERGITIVLVEHVMPVVMALAERIVVLQFGRIIANGAPREIMRNQTVIEAYLGKRKVA
jgi:branched-chain amino acid transport system ATP-binding protein